VGQETQTELSLEQLDMSSLTWAAWHEQH